MIFKRIFYANQLIKKNTYNILKSCKRQFYDIIFMNIVNIYVYYKKI